MNPDIEEQLRLTLQGRAGNVDDTRDHSRAAIDRSRVIRRNRTRLTVATSVAAVAAIVPAVLFTGDRLSGTEAPIAPPSSVSPTTAPTPTTVPTSGGSPSVPPGRSSNPATSATRTNSTEPPAPTKVTLDLARLPRGEAPRTVYLDGRTVVTPAGRVRVPGTGTIAQAIRAGGRVFALTVPADGSSGSLMLDLPLGGGSGSQVSDVSDLRASADGAAGAYAITRQNSDGSPLKGTTLHYRSGSTGSELALPAAYGVDLHAVSGDTVYFSARNARQQTGALQRWTVGERTTDTISPVRTPVFVSADGEVAGRLVDPNSDSNCREVVDLPGGDVRWRTCDYGPRGLVGDDAVLAGPAMGDGYADALFAVLDARTGELLHEWRAWVLRTTVESDNSVLAEVEDDGKHALVRCTVSTGKCELASPLADGAGPDEPRRYNLGS